MSNATREMIADTVYQGRPWSLETLSDRAFARLFQGLVYPQIWEDPVCDMEALQLSADDHIVCIASGGCNVMSYLTAGPASLQAVDLSPWHVELNRLKLLAAQKLPDHALFYQLFGRADTRANLETFDQFLLPAMDEDAVAFWNGRDRLTQRKALFTKGFYRFGVLGRFIGLVHLVAKIARVDFRPLLTAPTLDAQKAFFDTQIAPLYRSRFVRFAARRRVSLFGLGIPPAQYDKLAADSSDGIVAVLEERTRKLFCDFPISENYFAWQAVARSYAPDGQGPVPPYLQREHFEAIAAAAPRASVVNRSLTDVLAETASNSKTVYVLLDAQDWMDDQQLNALWQQITRTAAPGARVLFRTGGAADILPGRVASEVLEQWGYDADASARAFKNDRSAIYGGVHLYRRKD